MKIVATMLAHTIWRKIKPEELEKADTVLNQLLYEQLREKDYHFVNRIVRFALEQRRINNDLYKKLFTINRCIALKNLEQIDEMKAVLNSLDWSSASNDFILAKEVLYDNVDEAVILIRKIGVNSDFLKEYAFLEWPLFDHVRDDERFMNVYKELYGKDLVCQVNKLLTKTISVSIENET